VCRIDSNSTDLIAAIDFSNNVLDQSNSNDGTWTGTEQYADSEPNSKIGQAGDFDGTNDVVLANEANFDRTRFDPFSIAAWVNVRSAQSADGGIVVKGDGLATTDDGIHVYFRNALQEIVFRVGKLGAHRTITSSTNSVPKDI